MVTRHHKSMAKRGIPWLCRNCKVRKLYEIEVPAQENIDCPFGPPTLKLRKGKKDFFMEPKAILTQVQENKRTIGIGMAVAAALLAVLGLLALVIKNPQAGGPSSVVLPTVAVESKTQTTTRSTFSYKGKNGVDALTLLKENAMITQDKSGLVIEIDNKQADSKKREYWAFYVNGKLAPVGPADYKTKDTDLIKWTIEKY